MADTANTSSRDEEPTERVTATTSGTNYKVLGELTDPSGVGVLGRNAAGSGTPIGVEGTVPNTGSGYGLATPDDARIEGTVDTNGTDFVVETGTTSTGGPRNVVQGHASNAVTDGAVGATVGGGGYDDGSTAWPNEVHDEYGTVGGGRGNDAGSPFDDDPLSARYATVGGGERNDAFGAGATVAGGRFNTASGDNATVGGGRSAVANANNATAGGGKQNVASGQEATIGGGFGNRAKQKGATIAGGGDVSKSTPRNVVYDYFGTIGGGDGNQAGSDDGLTDSATFATVGGGQDNTASGEAATVPGGSFNVADGDYSLAAGSLAKAADNGAFVWNDGYTYHDFDGDSSLDGLSSAKTVAGSGEPTGLGTFNVGATGGVRMITGSSSVTYISGGSTGWSTTSTRAAKTNVDPVDPAEVLAGVEDLEVATWEYAQEDGGGQGTRHIGPMAEEFHDAFDVGDDEEAINSVNADGVLFAAVQGLARKLEEKDARIDDLEDRLASVESRLEPRPDGAGTAEEVGR